MLLNLDDYFISIESLNNFDDNNIENWINSSKKPKKIEKKLKKISENGGKFTANQFDVIATDCVKIPFLLKNEEKWNIQFGEARMVHFFPSFEINLDETIDNEEKSRLSIHLNTTSESTNNLKLSNNNQSIIEENNLKTKKTTKNNVKNRLSIDLGKNSESVINLSNNNQSIIEERNNLEVKNTTKKRKYEENVLITEIKQEKDVNHIINTAEVKLEEISPPKKKKKRKTNNIEDLSIDNLNLIDQKIIDDEIIAKKKKKKSKVSFLADESLNQDDNNNIDFNLSSKLNESKFNSSEEIEAVSDVEKSHKKKKKKHSEIQEEVREVIKTEKKMKKNKKETE